MTKIKDILTQAEKNKTGISIYAGKDFFSGYIVKIAADFVTMICFIYDEDKEQYTYTTKLKIALRRITEVYVGIDHDDLPDWQQYTYPAWQHFYYDREGLYFAETERQKVVIQTPVKK